MVAMEIHDVSTCVFKVIYKKQCKWNCLKRTENVFSAAYANWTSVKSKLHPFCGLSGPHIHNTQDNLNFQCNSKQQPKVVMSVKVSQYFSSQKVEGLLLRTKVTD